MYCRRFSSISGVKIESYDPSRGGYLPGCSISPGTLLSIPFVQRVIRTVKKPRFPENVNISGQVTQTNIDTSD